MAELSHSRIASALAPFGITANRELAGAIRKYISTLLLWNQKVNLTRITGEDEILARHFGESMFASRFLPVSGGRLADLGSGAGFPGLALKILVPSLQVALVEPNAKKAAFLGEVVRQLELTGVQVVRKRIESMGPEELRADVVTSRAVGGFHALLSWSREALEGHGRVVLWIGESGLEAAVKQKGWVWQESVLIPGSDKRYLLVGDKA